MLRRAAAEAETRTLERTSELLKANEALRNQTRERERLERELQKSNAESEARTTELRQVGDSMQAQIKDYEQTVRALRQASADAEGESRAGKLNCLRPTKHFRPGFSSWSARRHRCANRFRSPRPAQPSCIRPSKHCRPSCRYEVSGTALRQALDESHASESGWKSTAVSCRCSVKWAACCEPVSLWRRLLRSGSAD